MKNSNLISALSIDLGAKYTGVCSYNSNGNDIETASYLLEISDESKLSMSDRRARRCQRRAIKRKKLAKRLAIEIIEYLHNDQTINQNDLRFLKGLLNRRGYSFLVLSEVEDILKALEELKDEDLSFLCELFPDVFEKNISPQKAIVSVINPPKVNEERINEWEEQFKKQSSTKSKKQVAQKKDEENSDIENTSAENKNKILKLVRDIENYFKTLSDEINLGARHRTKYFEELKTELEKYQFEFELKITKTQLYRLLGNIANFQLRTLRKYFNGKTDNRYDDKKLTQILKRRIKSLHFKENEENLKKSFIEFYKTINDEGALSALLKIEPASVIPPYEDMNNRNIEGCASLLLDPQKLDKFEPQWRELANSAIKFLEETHRQFPEETIYNPYFFFENISVDENLKNKEDEILARKLQRIFDRSKAFDLFDFRETVSSLSEGKKLSEKTVAKFSNFLTEVELLKLYNLADQYYKECDQGKKGLWSHSASSLLKRCDHKTKRKNNIKNLLVENILYAKFADANDFDKFLNECWNAKIENERQTLKNFCRKVEEIRKKHGNTFAERYNYIRWKKDKENLSKEEKEIQNIFEKSKTAAEHIRKYFNHNESIKRRYANPFSLAQLYNILEADIRGFARSCLHCLKEDNWRSSIVRGASKKDKLIEAANAVRLAKDSVRPIDGVLRRAIDIHAKKIAEIKRKEIEKLFAANPHASEVFVPIVIEQNAFAFTESLQSMKKSGLKKNLPKEQYVAANIFKNTICPYTGYKIAEANAEIDHIIARSESRKLYGVILNHPANLIKVSKKGNQDRITTTFTFDNLNVAYLKEIFPNFESKNKIKEHVIKTVKELKEKEDKGIAITFEMTTEKLEEIRHALFLDETNLEEKQIRRFAVELLKRHLLATRVNGVQMFLTKIIVNKLRKTFEDKNIKLEFDVHRIDSKEIRQLRESLAALKANPLFEKKENQSAFSHTIDAYLALHISKFDLFKKEKNDSTTYLNSIVSNLPKKLEIFKISKKRVSQRKKFKELSQLQIFDDSVFAEDFLSIIIKNGNIKLGFYPENAADIAQVMNFDNSTIDENSKDKEEALTGRPLIPNLFYDIKEFLKNGDDIIEFYLESIASNKMKIYSFDKLKVQNFLHNLFRKKVENPEQITEKEKNLELFFNQIAYYSKRADLKAILRDEKIKGKKINFKKVFVKPINETKINSLDYSDYYLNLNAECFSDDSSKKEKKEELWILDKKEFHEKNTRLKFELSRSSYFRKKINFNLYLPSDREWHKIYIQFFRILARESIKKNPNESTTVIEALNLAYDEIFKNENAKKTPSIYVAHYKRHRKRSLPIAANPSGGFRILKKDPTGKSFFQIKQSSALLTSYFTESLDYSVINELFLRSRNLSMVKTIDYDPELVKNAIVSADEWRKIKLPENLKKLIKDFYICPGTKIRAFVALGFDKTQFFDFISSDLKKSLDNNLLNLKSSIEKKYVSPKFLNMINSKNDGDAFNLKPNNNLDVLKIEENYVLVKYTLDGFPSKLKELFRQGEKYDPGY